MKNGLLDQEEVSISTPPKWLLIVCTKALISSRSGVFFDLSEGGAAIRRSNCGSDRGEPPAGSPIIRTIRSFHMSHRIAGLRAAEVLMSAKKLLAVAALSASLALPSKNRAFHCSKAAVRAASSP